MGNKRVPEIRFDSFSGEWEEFKLKDISKIYDGTHQTPKYTDSGVKFVSVENINDINNTDKFISKNDFEKSFKNKPEVGDIFMTRITAGIIGATAVVKNDSPMAYYVSLALIKPNKKVSSLFLNSYIATKTFKKELNKRIIHTAFPKKINLGDIGECSVSIPDKDEQLKLGVFIEQLEEIITIQEQELDTLEQTKQGFLQKMFPEDGATEPVVRLKEFSGVWESKRLSEIVVITKGSQKNRDSLSEIMTTNCPYPVYNGGIDVSGYTHEFNRESSIIISEGGASAGHVNYISGKFWSGGHNYTLDVVGNDVSFIKSYLDSKQKRLYTLKVGSGLPNIQKSALEGFKITIPSLEEQQKIGNFFKQLDKTIALHEVELETLKQTQKAFLQKMFV